MEYQSNKGVVGFFFFLPKYTDVFRVIYRRVNDFSFLFFFQGDKRDYENYVVTINSRKLLIPKRIRNCLSVIHTYIMVLYYLTKHNNNTSMIDDVTGRNEQKQCVVNSDCFRILLYYIR